MSDWSQPHSQVPDEKCWCGKIHVPTGDWVLPPPAVIPPVVTSHKETDWEKARRLALESQELVPFYIFETVGEDPRNGKICEIIARAGLDPSDSEPQFKVIFNNGETEVCLSSELHPWFPAR